MDVLSADQAMVSHTVRGLQIIMDVLQKTSVKYNMRINRKKSKVMGISHGEGRPIRITVNGQNHKNIKSKTIFYLGSLVTEDGKVRSEKENCIGKSF